MLKQYMPPIKRLTITLTAVAICALGWMTLDHFQKPATAKTSAKKQSADNPKGYYDPKSDTFVQTSPKQAVKVTTTYKAVSLDRYFVKYLDRLEAKLSKMVNRGATKEEIRKEALKARIELRKREMGLKAMVAKKAEDARRSLRSIREINIRKIEQRR